MLSATLETERADAQAQTGVRRGIVLSIHALPVLVVLLAISFLLALRDYAAHGLDLWLGWEQVRRVLNVDAESSIPTWFSTVQLLSAAGLLLFVTLHHRQVRASYTAHWSLLSLLFLAFSIDEAVSIHENSTLFLNQDVTGLHWVEIGAVFTLVIAAVYIRFLAALPRKTCALFCLGGGLFVGGALGVEAIGFGVAAGSTFKVMLVGVEELLERTGVSVFIFTLLLYMREVIGWQRITLA